MKQEANKKEIEANALDLGSEMEWLREIIKARFAGPLEVALVIPEPPALSGRSMFSEFVTKNVTTKEERLILALALAPHINPMILDRLLGERSMEGVYGNGRAQNAAPFLPTVQTFYFLFCGNDLNLKLVHAELFRAHQLLFSGQVIFLKSPDNGLPLLYSSLNINPEFLERFTSGLEYKPDYSSNFPAKRVHTHLSWNDLFVDKETLRHLDEIKTWLRYKDIFYTDWGMDKKYKPGYRALFYGPPGTGKTFTASLLGKEFGIDVYKIDLSSVVSKYIGETEKNLEKIFSLAENKNWILFFDEADALFGKRTSVSDAHDKYANQEVAYLLQRLEDFNGLVILASNMRNNMDEAFSRRINNFIHFGLPKQDERYNIWKNAFNKKCRFEENIDLRSISQKYELSGGSVMNIVKYVSFESLKKGSDRMIHHADLMHGIRKEYHKSGKIF